MLSVVTYLWSGSPGGKYTTYRSDDVRRLQRMVAKHLTIEHRFIVVTDQTGSFSDDSDIHAVPIDWKTHVPGTCFVRLFTFSPMAEKVLGERILQLDLDTLIVGNLDSIVDREEDLVLWRNPRKWALTFPEVGYAKKLAWFNASVILLKARSWQIIWRNFKANDPGAKDDQYLISDYVGKDSSYWDQSHGVYRLAPIRRKHLGVFESLPENASIVNFPGDAAKTFLRGNFTETPWIERHRI